jgi:Tfp pilus assembly protein PilF
VRTPTRRTASVVAVVLAGLLACGCSGSDGTASHPASTASSDPAGSDAVATLVRTGLKQLEAGDDRSARGTFQSVLTLDPGNVYAHYNLGLIAQRAAQEDRAADEYDAALETDPDFAPALFNRGIIAESDDLDAAIALYRRAVDADPQFAAAFMRLGFALVHQGKDEEGQTYLGKGVALDPSMARVPAPTYSR